jgi:tocopherol O-methyltransferase
MLKRALHFERGFKHYVAMPLYTDKKTIREHYDRVSPYYQSFWGEHIHHGYWIRGDETKEEAQNQLIDHLATLAKVPRGATILDIGCGYGGSSIYLAQKYGVHATGITISPVQVEMATRAAEKAGANAKFLCMDAEAMTFEEPFDVIWSVESISHYPNYKKFFASAANLLKPDGPMAVIDWFKKDGLTPREHKKHLQPIEKGMMIELHTMEEYEQLMAENGLKVEASEVLNEHCARSWDIGLQIIKDKAFWAMAAELGVAFVDFLKAFKALRDGFASGNFVYGLIVARKP